MATTVERIGVVETKVENLSDKLDDLKVDVKEMHDCLDKMYQASCDQHSSLAKEISYIKSQRDRLIWTFAGIVAAGGFFAGHADKILKIFGG